MMDTSLLPIHMVNNYIHVIGDNNVQLKDQRRETAHEQKQWTTEGAFVLREFSCGVSVVGSDLRETLLMSSWMAGRTQRDCTGGHVGHVVSSTWSMGSR